MAVLALLAATACEGTGDGSEAGDRGEAESTLGLDAPTCDAELLQSDGVIEFVVAHAVENGQLAEVCLGSEDAVVLDAWRQLAAITPPGQRADLAMFAGFTSDEGGDEVTMAFVEPVDSDGSQFLMSVNVDTAADDPDELLLTMAHEFSHVFTAVETQLDRSSEAFESCPTYFNGEGCYHPDSVMYQWIESFWGDGLIDEIDPYAMPTVEDGQARCDMDPGFFGPYAATNPEEDFAESFSAYVFDVEPDTAEQQAKLDWIDARSGLAEFRELSIDAGLPALPNNFEACG